MKELTRYKLLLLVARSKLGVELGGVEPGAVRLEVFYALLREGPVGEPVVMYGLAPHLSHKQ